MPEARILFDSVGWRDADGDTVYGERGQIVELPETELARLHAAGAVEWAEPAAPKPAEPEPEPERQQPARKRR